MSILAIELSSALRIGNPGGNQYLYGPDFSGNARNAQAIDIQTYRADSTLVASGNYAIAIGTSVTASQSGAIAVGKSTVVSGFHAIGIGTNAVGLDHGVAIGYNAILGGIDSIAIGAGANTGTGGNNVAIGDGSQVTGAITDGVAIGSGATVSGAGSIAIGGNSPIASGVYSIAFGAYARASNVQCIAIGASANATGLNSVAIGSNAANAFGDFSITLDGTANSDNCISLGYSANISDDAHRSIAIGANANIPQFSTDCIAIGYNVGIFGATNAIAIGINNTVSNSVRIGTAVDRGIEIDETESPTDTVLSITLNTGLKRISVGAVDSGGAGYRALRVTN